MSEHGVLVDEELFREAMRRFPSGVTIVTTVDAAGRRWGFTASAFAALSVNPPLVLVCLDRSADCHPTFGLTGRFAVNILGLHHTSLAVRFATKGEDKFAAENFVDGVLGAPRLPDAVATVECEVEARYPGGDHTILVGSVQHAHLGSETPVVYARRRFFDAPV